MIRVRTRTWFALVVSASLLFMLGSRFTMFDPFENAALTVASPIETGLRDATRPVADFFNNLTNVNRLSDENQSLREENERLRVQAAQLQGADTELTQLEQLNSIREAKPNDTFVGANVFANDTNNERRVLAIDRGKSAGVQEGMVVITRQGSLIGSVTRALDDVAWVTLVTDPTAGVSAIIQSSRVQGVVAGSPDGTLTMEFVEDTGDVKEGDLVMTSGIGGRHPPGEVIGRVVEVSSAAQELFQSVRVEPLADLEHLESVLVLDSFLPAEPGQP
jgi:rod shape-determining protein MreC